MVWNQIPIAGLGGICLLGLQVRSLATLEVELGMAASGWLTKKRICNIPRMRDGLQVRGVSTLLVIHYADLRVAF